MNDQETTMSTTVAARIEPLLTVDEVAEILRIAPCTVRLWCRIGAMPHVKLNRELRFEATAIKRFIQNNRDMIDDDSCNSQATGSEQAQADDPTGHDGGAAV